MSNTDKVVAIPAISLGTIWLFYEKWVPSMIQDNSFLGGLFYSVLLIGSLIWFVTLVQNKFVRIFFSILAFLMGAISAPILCLKFQEEYVPKPIKHQIYYPKGSSRISARFYNAGGVDLNTEYVYAALLNWDTKEVQKLTTNNPLAKIKSHALQLFSFDSEANMRLNITPTTYLFVLFVSKQLKNGYSFQQFYTWDNGEEWATYDFAKIDKDDAPLIQSIIDMTDLCFNESKGSEKLITCLERSIPGSQVVKKVNK